MGFKNLDWHAAKAAQQIIKNTANIDTKNKKTENLVTKTLGVLQENGIYAAVLFLCAHSDKQIAKEIQKNLFALLTEGLGMNVITDTADSQAYLEYLTSHVCHDLDRLLMVKQLWEQTLIYARYGAKARR